MSDLESSKFSAHHPDDIKRFTSRLSSHMSALSDGLPFSDLEDDEDADQSSERSDCLLTDRGKVIRSCMRSLKSKENNHTDHPEVLSSEPLFRSYTPPASCDVPGSSNEPQDVTPSKPIPHYDDPVTPTANLKLLLSAVSPDIRNLEQQRMNETYEFSVDDLSAADIATLSDGLDHILGGDT